MPTIIYNNKTMYCAVEKIAITRLISFYGTSYNLVKDKRYPREQVFYPAIDNFKSNVPLSEVKEKYPSHFCFAFVRNPFDRSVSHYELSQFKKEVPFADYIGDIRYNNLPPMSKSLDVMPDFVGKFETLQEDFDKLNRILGISYTGEKHPLEYKANVSKRKKDWKQYYNAETIRIVEKIYKIDFERFGYI